MKQKSSKMSRVGRIEGKAGPEYAYECTKIMKLSMSVRNGCRGSSVERSVVEGER